MARTELVGSEKADFERLEKTIREGLQTFVDVGAALMEIRDRELYKKALGYSTFEAYVQIRWKMSRAHAYRQIEAAQVVGFLSPRGDMDPPPPPTEKHARPLTTLPPEQQREAWTEAVEESGGKPTAKDVQRAVDKRRDLPKVPRPKREKPEDTAAAIASTHRASEQSAPEPDGSTDATESNPPSGVGEPTGATRPQLAPKRRPNIAHLMNVIEAATGISGDTSDDEIRAIPFNDLMGQRLRAARDLIDRVLSMHANKEMSA